MNDNMVANAIEIRDVRKTFITYEGESLGLLAMLMKKKTEKRALKGVSFNVKKGSITALLGKNGSGKSTMIKLLVGIMPPDKGTVRVLGMDPWRDRIKLARHTGVVLGAHPSMFVDLPAIQSFDYMRRIYKVPKREFEERQEHFIRMLELEEVAKRRQVRELSLGEKMKCNFVAAVLHNPELIILDEPTIGVDLPSTLKIRKAALELQKKYGATFLIATHILEDVKVLAENVVIMDQGNIVFNDSKSRLGRLFGNYKMVEIYFTKGAKMNFSELGTIVDKREAYVKLRIKGGKGKDKLLTQFLTKKEVIDYNVSTPEIGDVMGKFYSER